jgi:hypothetical protein
VIESTPAAAPDSGTFDSVTLDSGTDVLRPHAEQQFAAELAALRAVDDRPRPVNWRLSPWAVVTYLLGGMAG